LVHVIVGPYDSESVPVSFSHEHSEDSSGFQKALWPPNDPGRQIDEDILEGRPK
jgi:hypothetical protein